MNKKDLIQQYKLTPTFYGVIQIKNNQTGQTFIDAVPNIHNRWGYYQANLNNHFYHDTALQADWDRLGADAFSYRVHWKKDTTDVINLRHKLKDLKQEWLENPSLLITKIRRIKMTELNTQATPIDQATWARREYFYYFTKMMPTGFTLNVDIDITATKAWLTKHDRKFNPAYLYLVTKLITKHPEFRVGQVDGQLVEYDVLHPSYSIFHGDDLSISSLWTAYDPSFEQFYQNYLADQATYGNHHTPMPKAPQSTNTYMIGSIPWTHFTSYTPLLFTPLNTFFPVIQAGRFTFKDGQWLMPLSFTIHHAVADGYHVSQFFNELQRVFDHPELWLTA